jgi:hypothetical protein
MPKTWPNVNPRYGPKPVPTNYEAHAVAATAFVVMTYTHKARVKEVEPSGRIFKSSLTWRLQS